MTDASTETRVVRAARGNVRTAKSWGAEAAKRMLMNNLDPEVAEHPEDLVVYGGTGKAARSWEAYDAIVRTLDELEPDETLLVQSGKPVGVFRTHEWAPRVLIANSNLVGDWATWPEFRRLEQLGLTMYGQMTAGSWIYIGTQGILQGTYETFAAVARSLGPGFSGGHLDSDRRMRRHGRRAAAGRDPQRRSGADRRRRRVAPRAPRRARLPRRVHDRPRRGRRSGSSPRRTRAARCRSASSATPRSCSPSCCCAARRSTSSPTRPAPTTRCRTCRSASTSRTGRPRPSATPRASPTARAAAWPSRSPRWSDSRMPAPRSSTTATRSAPRRSSAASSGRSSSPASCRRTSGRSSPRAGDRSAGWRSRVTPRTSARPTRRSRRSSPTTPRLVRWLEKAGDTVHFEGLPARICWLGYQERHLAGLKFNEMVASGELAGPIVIGRDHLDAGSVASPYRETEAMADGSDAIADWPLLNALLNTASGASWVSIHHGGGVGIGRSIHAGQVTVADGTAARRREARARAHERPRHRGDAARRRRLRPREGGRPRARPEGADAVTRAR